MTALSFFAPLSSPLFIAGSPGLFGNGEGAPHQNGPQCSGLCPAGAFCGKATVIPTACPEGSYCIVGSPTPASCPQYSTTLNESSTSISQCLCLQGFEKSIVDGNPVCECAAGLEINDGARCRYVDRDSLTRYTLPAFPTLFYTISPFP